LKIITLERIYIQAGQLWFSKRPEFIIDLRYLLFEKQNCVLQDGGC